MKYVLCLGVLVASAVWADEAADRAAIETTISALNTSPSSPELFTADFPSAAELESLREKQTETVVPAAIPVPARGTVIQTASGTVVISREPMGEATWYPAFPPITISIPARFVTRSVTIIAPDTAVVIAAYARQSVLFVVKKVQADWRIASFRLLPEAAPRAL